MFSICLPPIKVFMIDSHYFTFLNGDDAAIKSLSHTVNQPLECLLNFPGMG